ncbi:MAG: hypothetical protein WC054_11195 [Candidatus Nanopelagicales bacterium]
MTTMVRGRNVMVAAKVVALAAAPIAVSAATSAATQSAAPLKAAPAPAPLNPAQPESRAARALQPSAPASKRLPGTKCRAFPASNAWHADVSALPVHPRSAQWLASTEAASTDLHPDFGPSFGAQSVPYGIPITVVKSKKKPKQRVRFGYADESDNVRYPLNRKTKIEGGRNASGDRHAIVVHAKTCTLYETWNTRLTGSGWTAGSGAVWSLRSNKLRPAGWTSADAAGLPILPGLLRWDEVTSGKVDHAIRFTIGSSHNSYLWPARHRAGPTNDPGVPPMGARFRLKSSFDISGYSAHARVILRAMQRHGMVVADNGSDWYFQGTADTRWPNSLISELKRIPASGFEAVDVAPLQISPNSGKARR